MGDALLIAGILASLAAIGGLRASWARKQRSGRANALAWALLLAGCVLGGMAEGAWGIAVVSLFAMGLAAVLLAHAAATAPPGHSKASDRRVRMLPQAGEPLGLASRFTTFALVVLGGFAASVGFAIGLRWLMLLLGTGEADANAAALIAVPLAWAVVTAIVLMQRDRLTQMLALSLAAMPLVPALLTGG